MRAHTPSDVYSARVRLRAGLGLALAALGPLRSAVASAAGTSSAAPAREEVAEGGAQAPVELGGYLDFDAVLWDQSSADALTPAGEPLNEERVMLRRARLRARVAQGAFGGGVELDANTVRGFQVRPIAAELSFRVGSSGRDAVPLFQATVGLFKVPFGFETQEKTEQRRFLEPSAMTRALFAGDYDLGVRLHGGYEVLRWQLAVVNGAPIGQRTLPGRDPSAGLDVLGRAGLSAPVLPGLVIDAGFSLLFGSGFHAGRPATADALSWSDRDGDGTLDPDELTGVPGKGATPSATFGRSGLGGDLRVTAKLPGVGELFAYAEVMVGENLDRGLVPADPIEAGRDLGERGFALGLTQVLGDHLLLGARWDRYTPDVEATVELGGQTVPQDSVYETLTFIATARFTPHARLSLQYERNRSPGPRGARGEETTVPDDALIARAHLGF